MFSYNMLERRSSEQVLLEPGSVVSMPAYKLDGFISGGARIVGTGSL